MERLPLSGKTVLVTRGKEQAKEFSDKLKQAGAHPIEIPLISVSAVTETEKIDECICRLSLYDWIIFTSVNGVRFFFPFVGDQAKLPTIAVVGKKNGARFREKRYSASRCSRRICRGRIGGSDEIACEAE